MKAWEKVARTAVFNAVYGNDPEAVPTYRVPKHKPWWAFWRPTEWETITGVSRAQWARVQAAQDAEIQRRLKLCQERYPNAGPYFNLYSPLLDK